MLRFILIYKKEVKPMNTIYYEDLIATIKRNVKSISNSSVTSIGYSAFNNCSSLTSVNLPNVISINDYAFSNCSSLTSVNLPSVISINDYVFGDCSSLTSVDLPNVTSIGESTFYNCSLLTSVDLPNATSIGYFAFNYCSSLTSIDLPNATSIGEFAFENCSSLTSIDLPNATSIGRYAFNYCSSLTSISLPDVTSIGDSAFNSCSSLTSISLPNVISIGYSTFYNCFLLTSVDLPNVTSIGDSAFNYCSSLTSISLPDVTSIGDSVFNNCSSLTSISLPNVTSIGNSAFSNCSSLTSVNLPSVISINDYVFGDCSSLTSIHFAAKNKEIIEALSGYFFKFGAINATIYFDVTIKLLEVNDITYIINGLLVTSNDLTDENIYYATLNTTYTIVAYKPGYCLIIDSIIPENESTFDFTYTPTNWSTTGTIYTIDASSAPSGTSTIQFMYNGSKFSSVDASISSIIVPPGTKIDYKVLLKGYKPIIGTLESTTDKTLTISNWEVPTQVTYDMSYPFTGYDNILANLVDNNNFTIAESPTPNNSSYNTMSPSIVSGAKTFQTNSSYAYGYIKFHTPATTDTNLLTVSVTCNAYAESSYDVGFVFIDKSLHEITSNVRPSTASGTTDSTYGYMLYNSYGKSSAAYSTYTKVLDADTDYYLQFAYTKDSSSNRYWDRLSITNIKFTDEGTY